ncbi:MAG: hypothetical protein IPL89_08265 [Acidobacteria bacterium]|nr:hypothetical protein [Acidobacteriota bacterium]
MSGPGERRDLDAPPALTALSPNHGDSQGGTFVTLTAGCVAPGASVTFGSAVADPWVSPEQPPLQVFTGGHAPGAVDAAVTNPDGQAAVLAGGYTYECDTRAPAASNNGPICAGSSLVLGAPYFAGATYAWTGPNGFSANTRFVTISSATVAQSGPYTVTIGDVFGCTLPPATTTAVVNPRPSAAISAPSSVFARSTGNVASVPDGGPGAFYNWAITNAGGTITSPNTARSITFDAGASGDIAVNVYVSSGNCSNSSAATIPITPRPTLLQVVTPCRLVDTRLPAGPGGGPALAAGVIRNFPLAGRCGVPADATAVAVNATVTLPSSAGSLRVYPGGTPTPGTTNLSFGVGQTRAGSSIVGLGPDGSVDVVSTQAAGTVHVILDVSGYFK